MALFYDDEFERSRTRGQRFQQGRGMYDRGFGASGYDRGYGSHASAYDRGFKDRWQTDNGDPFGDREARTPMRMMRGPFGHEHGYDRDMQGGFRGGPGYDRGTHGEFRGGRGYGRDMGARSAPGGMPVGYDPYTQYDTMQGGTWAGGGYDRGFRGGRHGYDSRWF